MNSYLVNFASGTSVEIDADSYEREGNDWVFTAAGREVLRAGVEEVAAITKTH